MWLLNGLIRSSNSRWICNEFCKSSKETGLKNSDVPIKLIKINNSVEIEEENKFISIEKSNTSLEIEFEINYKINHSETKK